MSASASSRTASLRRDPLLPPGFTCTTLRESGDAFAHAVAHADELGAASLVWVRRFDLVEFAVVLEPEEPLITARLAHYMGMNALADTMAIHCPPERPMMFSWPDAILMDHGLLGGGRTAWPADCTATEAPRWLVFGAMLRAASLLDLESGERSAMPGAGIAMDELGFEDVAPVDLVESFRREGVAHVHAVVVGDQARVEPEAPRVEEGQHGEERRSLIEALDRAEWFDPLRREPKL
ncbi:MAG: hypothetical protein NTW00_14895 [Hyphomicrobiales bacterium]|nr:hypothetical protein [Hyphomicrobiales bacterium]